MHPRPLHRWKSFWFGLLVLAFLGWAWARSYHQENRISFRASPVSTAWISSNRAGVVLLGWESNPLIPGGLHVSTYPNKLNANWSSGAVALKGGRGWQVIRIAHWFLILLFIVPWAGFLFWRVRRMRRVGETPTSVEN
jgi:hypothetical protein